MKQFIAGFVAAAALAALLVAAWVRWQYPLRNHVVASRPIGLKDQITGSVVALPAGTELYTLYSVTAPPSDDYGSDAFVRITISDTRAARRLGLRPAPVKDDIPTLNLVAPPGGDQK